jgi:hypothetical protein
MPREWGHPANRMAVDRFRRQSYSVAHPIGPHLLGRGFDMGNPGLHHPYETGLG